MNTQGVRRSLLTGGAVAWLALLPAVHAQSIPLPDQSLPVVSSTRDWSGDIPAHLWAVDGVASLEREGRLETAEENTALVAGDRLRTDRGRVEVLFDDGSALDVDEFSRIDLLGDSLVRLTEGRIRLTLARGADAFDYRIDTAAGSALIRTAGEYRIWLAGGRAADPELHVTVLRGQAELANQYGRTPLRAGYEGVVTASRAPSVPYVVNVAQWDAFDRWVENIHAERLGTSSAQYLPADLSYYGGTFDNYGSWDYLPSYGGYVWYPRVAVGWRPYSVGRWSFYSSFGWFWVGADRWSWPTHHYGRWGLHANRWYWVPGHAWAPSWVAWGGAPGYTSWCPLGFDGRPVVAFSSVRYVDPWVAWTVVPTRVFVNNVVVTHHAVGYQSIAPGVRSQFQVRPYAPTLGNGPITRAQPLRAPTVGQAVVRDGRAMPTRSFDRTGTPAGGGAVGPGRPRPSDLSSGPQSTAGVVDASRSRIAAPSAGVSEAPSRSRVPSRAEVSRGASRGTRLDPPARLEMPSRPETSRLQTPPVQMPPAPQARPRDGSDSGFRAAEMPSRSYRSREPQSAPGDNSGPPSRVYRSSDPDSGSNSPSRPWTPSRIPDRSGPPPDRGQTEGPAVRTRPPGGDAPRAEPPQGRSRVEPRAPSSSDRPSGPPPSRTGGDSRPSSSSGSSSSSGRAGGQAVRRGGG
jgi:uncharacterized protein DUF6600/FecR-like protein